MSHNDVRKGMTNARFNEEQMGILSGEIAIIAIVAGIYTKSWLIFGATFVGLAAALAFPIVAIPLMVLLSIGWGVIGYSIGSLVGSKDASVVLGIIGLLAGLGVHMAAIKWVEDIGD